MVNREESRIGFGMVRMEVAGRYGVGENQQHALNGQAVVGCLKFVFSICSQLYEATESCSGLLDVVVGVLEGVISTA